jgi:TolA-binding protein
MNGLEKLSDFVEHNAPGVSEDSLQRGRARFIEATRQGEASGGWRARYRWAVWLMPVTLLGVLLVWGLRSQTPGLGPVAANPAPGPSAVRLEVPAQGPSSLELEAGTTAELSQGTLAYASAPGAGKRRIDLVRGKLRLSVDPARKTSWVVTAGTVEVSVVGTIFSVERDAISKDVRVDVERGLVRVVSGSGGSRQVQLSAGQSLVARAEKLEVTGTSAPAEAAEAPPAASSSGGRSPGSEAALQPSVQEAFHTRYRARDYRGALTAAEQAGFEGLLGAWDRGSLSRLADAARLAGEPGRARQALERLRGRFPGSREAADAAFLLGRLHADALGAPAAAAGWFERYLAESANGSFAQEALGRLMVAARAAGDNGKAKSVASDYLERYPQGPYARTAASLLR